MKLHLLFVLSFVLAYIGWGNQQKRVSTDNSLFFNPLPRSHSHPFFWKVHFQLTNSKITDLWSSLFISNAQDIAMTPLWPLLFGMCQLNVGCRLFLFSFLFFWRATDYISVAREKVICSFTHIHIYSSERWNLNCHKKFTQCSLFN